VVFIINCPNCGEITKDSVKVYNESLRKQNIRISPILPTCKVCGSDVAVSHTCNGGNIIVLNGTCGSGKTTIAELLAEKGWFPIDGDCAIQSLRYKKGTKQYEWNELIDEIACEIDILSLFCKNIVLSHIVLPEDIDKYVEIFESRNIKYKFILLKPDYHTAVERCQTRICHTSITPEKWIRHFYDILVFDDGRFDIIDNSVMTAQETTETILDLLEDENE
jgi:gluconate kinase